MKAIAGIVIIATLAKEGNGIVYGEKYEYPEYCSKHMERNQVPEMKGKKEDFRLIQVQVKHTDSRDFGDGRDEEDIGSYKTWGKDARVKM